MAERKTPASRSDRDVTPLRADVARFLGDARALSAPATETPVASGRLAVILDATMSRKPTWDAACAVQADMFDAVAGLGDLQVNLVFFRGAGELRSSGWTSDPRALARRMTGVTCRAGRTQVRRALAYVLGEAETARVRAFAYVGDAFEEDIDAAGEVAGRLALRGVKGFLFHEGGDPVARDAFQEIARLTGGAYHPFDLSSAGVLKALLSAAAAYAAGGRAGLIAHAGRTGGAASELLDRLGEEPRPS